uniref:Guided entry of tail-anchored proteins factor 1 n=1 Tax=Strongyloides stercoralis TaxID=6248 RepID=A0A0K0E3N3_STRER
METMNDTSDELYTDNVFQINQKLSNFSLLSSFLVIIIIRYWSFILTFLKNKLSIFIPMSKEEVLLKENNEEVQSLISERNKLLIKDDFSQYMKIERKIVKLELKKKEILEKMNGISNNSYVVNICLLIE